MLTSTCPYLRLFIICVFVCFSSYLYPCLVLFGLRSLNNDGRDWEQSQQEAANLSATINEILDSYDSKLRPNAGGKCLLIDPFTLSLLSASPA